MKNPVAYLREKELLKPLVLYGVSRLYFAFFMIVFASTLTADFTGRASEHFDYFTVATTGDNAWYRNIAENGYPKNLLIYDDGTAGKTSWAFYPLWPILIRALCDFSGLAYYQVASILVLLVGAAASLMAYKLLRAYKLSEKHSLIILGFMLFSPLAVLFSIAYTEALAFFLITLTLYLVAKKKYGYSLIPLFFLGLTRPITLAFVFFFAAVAFTHWKTHKKFSSETSKLLGLSFASGLIFGIWPTLMAVKFGRWDAYIFNQEAWRQYYTDPFIQWVAKFSIESFPLLGLWLGIIAFSIYLYTRTVIPKLLKYWSFSYLLFMLLTVPAGTAYFSDWNNGVTFYPSTVRYFMLGLIPFWPLIGLELAGKKRLCYYGAAGLIHIGLTLAYFYYFVPPFPTHAPYFWL